MLRDGPACLNAMEVSVSNPVPKVFRRGVDRTTYRKLGEAGLPIGPDGRVSENVSRGLRQAAARLSGAPQERLDALAARLTQDARERLERALAKARGE